MCVHTIVCVVCCWRSCVLTLRIYVIAFLVFEVVLWITPLLFLDKYDVFANFWFAEILVGVTPSFLVRSFVFYLSCFPFSLFCLFSFAVFVGLFCRSSCYWFRPRSFCIAFDTCLASSKDALRACFVLFFYLHICFLAFLLYLHINLVQHTPCFPSPEQNDPLCPWLLLLSGWPILSFKSWLYAKKMFFTTAHVSFCLAFDTHNRHAPCCAYLHTSVNVRVHFCQPSQKMISGEIFPTIEFKLGLVWPFSTLLQCLYVLCMSSHAPCTPKHPFMLIFKELDW